MKKRLLILLVSLMSIVLAGIVVVQVLWIKNAIAIKKEQFSHSVNEALNEVVSKLETRNTVMFLSENISDKIGDSLHVYQQNKILHNDNNRHPRVIVRKIMRDTAFIRPDHKKPSNRHYDNYVDDVEKKLKNERTAKVIGDVINGLDKHITNITISEYGGDSILVKRNDSMFKSDLTDNNTFIRSTDLDTSIKLHRKLKLEKVHHKVRELDKVYNQLALELETSEASVQKRLHLVNWDSIVTNELKNKGIYLPYEYGIIHGKRDSLLSLKSSVFTPSTKEEKYKVALFPNDIISKAYTLLVYFPKQNYSIVKSLTALLIGSLFFTIILLLTFTLSIIVIVKQKKISDIKSDFINNMTHEFKTPIATISLAVDAIESPKIISDKDKILFFSRKIKEENQRMNAQVEKILQIALIEKQNLNLTIRSIDLHKIIRTAIENISLQIEKRNGLIDFELGAQKSMAFVDEVHFTNVIFNLLDNANKYSPQTPEIMVTTQNSENEIIITIQDKGIGMTRDQQNKIFEKFYRVQSGNIHNVKGFGLGLNYVKAIIIAHKGRISVKSEKGKGSKFEIVLKTENC